MKTHLSHILLRVAFSSFFLGGLALICCKEEKELEPPQPKVIPVFKVHSVVPDKGVAGDTITITVANRGVYILSKVLVDKTPVIPFNVKDSIFQFVMIGDQGKHALNVEFGPNTAKKVDFFEILPFEFLGLTKTELRARPKGMLDTLFIKARNAPKDTRHYKIMEQVEVNGKVSYKQNSYENYMRVSRVTSDGVEFLVTAEPYTSLDVHVTLSLLVDSTEYQLEGLKFIGYYKLWKGSANNYPENEIILLTGNRLFSIYTSNGYESQVFLNGIKLKQNYQDPQLVDADGYGKIHSFAIPANMLPGEYELSVFELDGITRILPDSTNKVTISDIYFCAEKNSYREGTDMKIFISPNLYIFRCYSCPTSVSLWDVTRQNEFKCQIKGTGYTESKTHITVTLPADMPSSIFTIEMKTKNGYIYKAQPGCISSVVSISD